MGQNVHGLPKGVAAALDELNRHRTNARKTYTTEEDYYDAFVAAGSLTMGRRCIPRDPLRLRLWKRAQERYKNDFPTSYFKLQTVEEMVEEIQLHGISKFQNTFNSKDPKRITLMEKAIETYLNENIRND